jgi:hypothetical protein
VCSITHFLFTYLFLACRAADVHFIDELLEGRTLTSKSAFIRRVEGSSQVNLNVFQRHVVEMLRGF